MPMTHGRGRDDEYVQSSVRMAAPGRFYGPKVYAVVTS